MGTPSSFALSLSIYDIKGDEMGERLFSPSTNMKITTRIVSGYGLFIAVLAGLVVYQVITIDRLQAISRTLSQINFENARECLQAMRDRDLVEEFTKKSFASPDYVDSLRAQQEDFEKSLAELQSHAKSNEEQAEVKRLLQQWEAYKTDFGLPQPQLPQRSFLAAPPPGGSRWSQSTDRFRVPGQSAIHGCKG